MQLANIVLGACLGLVLLFSLAILTTILVFMPIDYKSMGLWFVGSFCGGYVVFRKAPSLLGAAFSKRMKLVHPTPETICPFEDLPVGTLFYALGWSGKRVPDHANVKLDRESYQHWRMKDSHPVFKILTVHLPVEVLSEEERQFLATLR